MQHLSGNDATKGVGGGAPVVNESSKSAGSTFTNVSNKTTVEEGRGSRTTTHLQEEKTYEQMQQITNKVITGRPEEIAPILRAEGYNYEPTNAAASRTSAYKSPSSQPPKSAPPKEPYGYRTSAKTPDAHFANDNSPGMSPSPSPVVGDVISSSTSSNKTRTVETVTVSIELLYQFVKQLTDIFL